MTKIVIDGVAIHSWRLASRDEETEQITIKKIEGTTDKYQLDIRKVKPGELVIEEYLPADNVRTEFHPIYGLAPHGYDENMLYRDEPGQRVLKFSRVYKKIESRQDRSRDDSNGAV